MGNENYESAMEWSGHDLINATNMIAGVTGIVAEQAVAALLKGGDIRDYKGFGKTISFDTLIDAFKSDRAEEELDHFGQALDVLCSIGINLFTEYRQAMRDAGLVSNPLPDPATVKVPDSADDIEW